MNATKEKIAILGLGYVGLPLALSISKCFEGTVGFDVNPKKIAELKHGIDANGEGLDALLKSTKLHITSDAAEMRGCSFFIVAVPTPVDADNRPDLEPLFKACETVGPYLGKGAVVVFESTVYPGLTEEICGPALARASGLRQGVDFKLGYSPERMNPGDKEHTFERIVKVVAGEDAESLERVAAVYGKVVDAGIFKAKSIRVAEAAKVIENTQRDLNIALMNELSIVFDRMGIRTKDVLDAAATKWNFIRFAPGLVGGHCIGVDPYYLTTKAQQLGYHPEVILAGRRINDGMGIFVAQRMVKLMVNSGQHIRGAKVGVLGITFKENVSDLRNSRVPSILSELKAFGVSVVVHDAFASPEAAKEEYGVDLVELNHLTDLDGLILAVSHRPYLEMGSKELFSRVKKGGVFVDIKSVVDPALCPQELTYWSL